MAIYHLKTSVGTRSGGQSAAAKSDYIHREGKYSRDPAELVHAESGNMPEWAEGRERLYWEAADAHERANGRLYREVEFALPVELDPAQRIEAAREFARKLCDGERLPYTLAIHRGASKEDGKPDNPHCHLIISERMNDGIERSAAVWFKRANRRDPERGGALKSTATRPKEWLEETRETWAEIANERLEQAGRSERIDERTLGAQLYDAMGEGWDPERTNPETGKQGYWTPEQEAKLERLARPPGRHRGPAASAIQSKHPDRETDRGRQLREETLWEQARGRLAALVERLSEIGQALTAQLDRARSKARLVEEREPAPAPARSFAPAPARPSLGEQARDVTKKQTPDKDKDLGPSR